LMKSLHTVGDSPMPLGEFLEAYLTPEGALFEPANYWDYPPEGRWKYSNVGATLGGYLVERLTNQDFADYCRKNVLKPLGMVKSSFRLTDIPIDDVAMPYEYQRFDDSFRPLGHRGMPYYPAGTLRTNAGELARLVVMMAGDGRIDGQQFLARETVEEIRRVQYPGRWPHQGLIWYYGEYNGERALGHQGGGTGVAAKMFFRPADGVGVVLLASGEWGSLVERLLVEQVMFTLFDTAERISPWRVPTVGPNQGLRPEPMNEPMMGANANDR